MRITDSITRESILFAGLLLAANLGLWSGTPRSEWMFRPSAVLQGEWLRLLLHPWVHVSGYHLLLDAAAFLCLFFMLDRTRAAERWSILAAVWAVSLLAVWLGDARVEALGFCGLSGIAHGLLAAVCVQWLRSPPWRHAGGILLVGLIVKASWEALGVQVLLSSLHAGPVGIPLTLSHAGGVLGGTVAALGTASRRRVRRLANL